MKIKRLIREALLEQNLLNQFKDLLPNVDIEGGVQDIKKKICSGKISDKVIRDNLDLGFELFKDELPKMLKNTIEDEIVGQNIILHVKRDLGFDGGWALRKFTDSYIKFRVTDVYTPSLSYSNGRINFSIKLRIWMYLEHWDEGEHINVTIKGNIKHKNRLVFEPTITDVNLDSDWIWESHWVWNAKISGGKLIIDFPVVGEKSIAVLKYDIRDELDDLVRGKSFDLCKMF